MSGIERKQKADRCRHCVGQREASWRRGKDRSSEELRQPSLRFEESRTFASRASSRADGFCRAGSVERFGGWSAIFRQARAGETSVRWPSWHCPVDLSADEATR